MSRPVHTSHAGIGIVSLQGDSPVDLEVRNKESYIEWLTMHYKDYGAGLQFVTDRSQEGAQFCKGFGGIGATLRYQLDFNQNNEVNMDGIEIDDDDFF